MNRRRTDYEQLAPIYDAGRSIPLEGIGAWRPLLDPYLSSTRRPILDLGSGTGLWTEAFTSWFDAHIVGVEPSDAMRREAAGKRLPASVDFVGGRAERIPLRRGSCECVWLSTVLHHISDLEACALELRRVIHSDGAVLIRSSFGDRLDGIHWLDFFPEGKRLAATRWPSVESTAETFRGAGFETVSLESVPEVVASDFIAYYERMRQRAHSTLNLISEQARVEGLAQLQRFAAGQSSSARVVDQRDFLILR